MLYPIELRAQTAAVTAPSALARDLVRRERRIVRHRRGFRKGPPRLDGRAGFSETKRHTHLGVPIILDPVLPTPLVIERTAQHHVVGQVHRQADRKNRM